MDALSKLRELEALSDSLRTDLTNLRDNLDALDGLLVEYGTAAAAEERKVRRLRNGGVTGTSGMARLVGVCPNTVRKLIRETDLGDLVWVDVEGRYRAKSADVEAWVESRQVRAA